MASSSGSAMKGKPPTGGAAMPTPLDVFERDMPASTERNQTIHRLPDAVLLTASVPNARLHQIAAMIHAAGQQGEITPYGMAEPLAARDIFVASEGYRAVIKDLIKPERVYIKFVTRR